MGVTQNIFKDFYDKYKSLKELKIFVAMQTLSDLINPQAFLAKSWFIIHVFLLPPLTQKVLWGWESFA